MWRYDSASQCSPDEVKIRLVHTKTGDEQLHCYTRLRPEDLAENQHLLNPPPPEPMPEPVEGEEPAPPPPPPPAPVLAEQSDEAFQAMVRTEVSALLSSLNASSEDRDVSADFAPEVQP